MNREAVVHYIGDSVESNVRILRYAMESIVGYSVRVAPLHDDMVTRMGVWLRGDINVLAEVMLDLGDRLKGKKVKFALSFWLDMKRDTTTERTGS